MDKRDESEEEKDEEEEEEGKEEEEEEGEEEEDMEVEEEEVEVIGCEEPFSNTPNCIAIIPGVAMRQSSTRNDMV